jgi:hypothetical protein
LDKTPLGFYEHHISRIGFRDFDYLTNHGNRIAVQDGTLWTRIDTGLALLTDNSIHVGFTILKDDGVCWANSHAFTTTITVFIID